MRRILLSLLLVLAVAAWVLPAAAQEPKADVQMYQVVLMQHGPNWKSQADQEGMDNRMVAIENIKKAAREGLVVAAGLVNDETNVEFILVLNVETKHEALALLDQAPNIKNGMFKPEVYSWFAKIAENFGK